LTIVTDQDPANACDDFAHDLAGQLTLADLDAWPDAISPARLAHVAELHGW
jgi:hypothetical protein